MTTKSNLDTAGFLSNTEAQAIPKDSPSAGIFSELFGIGRKIDSPFRHKRPTFFQSPTEDSKPKLEHAKVTLMNAFRNGDFKMFERAIAMFVNLAHDFEARSFFADELEEEFVDKTTGAKNRQARVPILEPFLYGIREDEGMFKKILNSFHEPIFRRLVQSINLGSIESRSSIGMNPMKRG